MFSDCGQLIEEKQSCIIYEVNGEPFIIIKIKDAHKTFKQMLKKHLSSRCRIDAYVSTKHETIDLILVDTFENENWFDMKFRPLQKKDLLADIFKFLKSNRWSVSVSVTQSKIVSIFIR